MADASDAWRDAWLRGQQEILSGWLRAMPGVPPGGPASGPAGGEPGGPTEDLARRFLGLYDQYAGVTRSLWESMQAGVPVTPPLQPLPALGLTRERQEASARLARLCARVAQAETRLATSWGELIERALARLAAKVEQRAAAGAPVDSLKGLYDLWIEAAESAYAETVHGRQYGELQAELANATSELVIEQRALFERWARDYDLPTRPELDSVHRRLKELTAELRALRSELARLRPAPRRRKSST